jgi:hypothetical protein
MLRRLLTRSPTESLNAALGWVQARPRWLRRALFGAALVYAFAISRGGLLALLALLVLFLTGHQSEAGRFLLVLLLVAPAGGFLGGLLHSASEPLAKHLGAVGRFLQRMAAGLGYATVLVYGVLPILDRTTDKSRATSSTVENLAIIGIIALLIGAVLSTEDGRSDASEPRTNWRFVATVVAVGGVLAGLMYLAGWV